MDNILQLHKQMQTISSLILLCLLSLVFASNPDEASSFSTAEPENSITGYNNLWSYAISSSGDLNVPIYFFVAFPVLICVLLMAILIPVAICTGCYAHKMQKREAAEQGGSYSKVPKYEQTYDVKDFAYNV